MSFLISELPFGSKPNDLPFKLVHHRFVMQMRDLVDEDTHKMMKEWNVLFALTDVTICPDGITSFAPWTNKRVPLHEYMNKLDRERGSDDEEGVHFRKNGAPRLQVHDLWREAGSNNNVGDLFDCVTIKSTITNPSVCFTSNEGLSL